MNDIRLVQIPTRPRLSSLTFWFLYASSLKQHEYVAKQDLIPLSVLDPRRLIVSASRRGTYRPNSASEVEESVPWTMTSDAIKHETTGTEFYLAMSWIFSSSKERAPHITDLGFLAESGFLAK